MKNVDSIYGAGRDDADTDVGADFVEQVPKSAALGKRCLLGVAERCMICTRRKDYRCGHHRTCERSAARLIGAGYSREAPVQEHTLEPERVCGIESA